MPRRTEVFFTMHRNGIAAPLAVVAALALAALPGTVFAHVRPQTESPQPNARMDAAPAHIVLNYDGSVVPSGTNITLLDGGGNAVPTAADPFPNDRTGSFSPMSDLAPGPYTVDWTTLDSQDGHEAQGFYTFVVNGGPVGILQGSSQSQAPAADLMASLTVTAAADGSSLLRVDLNNTSGVERVRIRLTRPDLGEDLLDTQPSGDGGWLLNGNEVAIPGPWRADVVVRRTNIFDDAEAGFDFAVDPTSGVPSFL
jgi:methionine-rich copper-binding protein CopC